MSSWREKLRNNVSDTCAFIVKYGPKLGWGSGFICSAFAMGSSILTAGPDPIITEQAASFLTKAALPAMIGGVTGIAVGVMADKFKDYCMEYYREWYDRVMQNKTSLAEDYRKLKPEAKAHIIQMLKDHPKSQEIFAKEGLLQHLLNDGAYRLSNAMDSADRIARETQASSPIATPKDRHTLNQ